MRFIQRMMSGVIGAALLLTMGGALAQRETPTPTPSPESGYALRFFGWGYDDVGRVKIPLTPDAPVNIGETDFTIEFWLRAEAADNATAPCQQGEDTWINGNILLDRDIFGAGDYGDYGVSIYGGQMAFGVHNGRSGVTLCSATAVADGAWHHIALTRRFEDGLLRIFIDGALDAEVDGPEGDLRYNPARGTSYPNSDPFLVIGAEKHDYDPALYPSYNGQLDELRFSTVLRYAEEFEPPTAPFTPDSDTAALYGFNACTGELIADTSEAEGGPSDGLLRYGGEPAGPIWSADTPFSDATVDAASPCPAVESAG